MLREALERAGVSWRARHGIGRRFAKLSEEEHDSYECSSRDRSASRPVRAGVWGQSPHGFAQRNAGKGPGKGVQHPSPAGAMIAFLSYDAWHLEGARGRRSLLRQSYREKAE